MHEQLSKLDDVLESSNFAFEKTEYDNNTIIYFAAPNADSELKFNIISVQDGDGYILKFVLTVDEIDDERAMGQLQSALKLNFITGLGKFAFNSDDGVVVYVLDYSLEMLDLVTFQSILDEYYHFTTLYYELVYPDDPGNYAGHD